MFNGWLKSLNKNRTHIFVHFVISLHSRFYYLASISVFYMDIYSFSLIRLFKIDIVVSLLLAIHRRYLLRLPVGRGGVINSPRSIFLFSFFYFFFRCRKLGYRSWAIPLYSIPIAEPMSTRLLN